MKKTSENKAHSLFRRTFRGYKKREVEEYIAHIEQERAITEENYQSRIALLVQENEHAAQMLKTLQEDKERLLSDAEEYKLQLKTHAETVQTLYERLDLLGMETERLQNTLADLKKKTNDDPTISEWKQRALTAEDTVRRLAEAELQEDRERENSHHIRLPFGKKAYLDLTLCKDDKSV